MLKRGLSTIVKGAPTPLPLFTHVELTCQSGDKGEKKEKKEKDKKEKKDKKDSKHKRTPSDVSVSEPDSVPHTPREGAATNGGGGGFVFGRYELVLYMVYLCRRCTHNFHQGPY
jgi:hypothetical protein